MVLRFLLSRCYNLIMDDGFDIPKPPPQENTGNVEVVDPLLQATIFNKDKDKRREAFTKAWQERWNTGYYGTNKPGYFATEENESPFSEYSSKGWKIHIAFEKGKEKDVAEALFVDGLYFKLESVIGTYFNGTKESGATVYIGSHDNMMAITEVIEQNLGSYLTEGSVATIPTRKIPLGSGADTEVKPRIMARFDVAKTPYGWISGNKKYTEKGLPSWLEVSGLPLLKTDEQETMLVVNKWNRLMPSQRQIYMDRTLRPAVDRAKTELARDFGQEFVFGKK